MLPPTSDVQATYQQLLEHTMLQPTGASVAGGPAGFGLNRVVGPLPAGPTGPGATGPIGPTAGLFGWHQAVTNLPPPSMPLDEVNCELRS